MDADAPRARYPQIGHAARRSGSLFAGHRPSNYYSPATRHAGRLRQTKNMTPQRLALFDLDHTLLPLDSDYQWADFLARTGRAGDPEQARRRNDDLMDRYNQGELTAEQAAEFMLGLLAAHTPYDLASWHEAFMAEVVR